MTRYAEQTQVSSDKSRAEIDRTLQRYGATAFMYGWAENAASVEFEMNGRRIRFRLPMPDRNAFELTPTGKARGAEQVQREWEKATRQRWRALVLVIKAKLEAVESGITVFEDEFMAHICLPSGETVGDWMRPQIAIAYDSGRMPKLLPGPAA